jgi:hypothetical protein
VSLFNEVHTRGIRLAPSQYGCGQCFYPRHVDAFGIHLACFVWLYRMYSFAHPLEKAVKDLHPPFIS